MSNILAQWDSTFIEVGKGPNRRVMALSEIDDQTVLYKFFVRRMKEWATAQGIALRTQSTPSE